MKTLNTKTAKVTGIEFYDNSHEVRISETETETVINYSANLTIEIDGKSLIATISGSDTEANPLEISDSSDSFIDSDFQDLCAEEVDPAELLEVLEAAGFENNFNYLEENS